MQEFVTIMQICPQKLVLLPLCQNMLPLIDMICVHQLKYVLTQNIKLRYYHGKRNENRLYIC